ncbi:TIGR02647 family protein [Haliea sp. E17]|uniref:TIGR02647 family protein n=1 Tax=Haliea sp. E17 TaxID=3401576 RepID=UPI003AABD868
MLFAPDAIEELNFLLQFDNSSMRNGLKVHSTAREEVVTACRSLYAKGLVSQPDGGYLTDEGIEALTHAQVLAGMMQVRQPENSSA